MGAGTPVEWISQAEAARRLGVTPRWLQELEDFCPPRLPGGSGTAVCYLWPTLQVWFEMLSVYREGKWDEWNFHAAAGFRNSWTMFRDLLTRDLCEFMTEHHFRNLLNQVAKHGLLSAENAFKCFLLAQVSVALWRTGGTAPDAEIRKLIAACQIKDPKALETWWADYLERHRIPAVIPSSGAAEGHVMALLMGYHTSNMDWLWDHFTRSTAGACPTCRISSPASEPA